MTLQGAASAGYAALTDLLTLAADVLGRPVHAALGDDEPPATAVCIAAADGRSRGALGVDGTASAREFVLLAGFAEQAERLLAAVDERAEQAVRLRAAEAERAELERELGRVLGRERDLVASMTHELRTPVTVIQGYLEALADDEDLRAYRPMLDPMRRSGDRLVRMVDHLLSGTGSAEEPVTVRPGHVDLVSVARAAVAVAVANARGRDVRIRLETPRGELPTSGDFGRLVQVADQLLSNALAFSAPGSEVVVRVAKRDGPSLSVADHGIGIPAEELPYLPERFFRGRHAREHAVPGLGLGLTIAEHIAGAHGGSLAITSAGPGEGTTAVLSLPALRLRAEACSIRRRARRRSRR